MWHGITFKFTSPSSLRSHLQESFPDDVPATKDFKLGYLEGNVKRWIVEDRDLSVMYSTFQPTSKITLWCEAKNEGQNDPPSKKRKLETASHELGSVDPIFEKLKALHPKMDNPKLRLWAKMIDKGRHDDYNEPPQIPLITGSSNSKKKSPSVADALANAATAIASAIQSPSSTPQTPKRVNSAVTESSSKFSPMSSARLRRSCLDDLKTLKELHQDGVVEFSDQKEKIMKTLKDIN